MIDLSGQKFYKLIVLERLPNKNKYGQVEWKCKCDCGVFCIVSSSHLRGGYKKSCGCLKRQIAKINGAKKINLKVLTEEQFAVNRIYSYYKHNAKRKNRDFLISKDQVKDLIYSKCKYCNRFPTQHIYKSYVYPHGHLVHSIDRVNSNVGYVSNNVVTCCQKCNIMKMDLSVEEFLEHVKLIAKNI